MASTTVVHPPACPDCSASLTSSVDAGFPMVGGGASGATLVVVRSANAQTRYRTEAVPGGLVTFPIRCGCGARWALTVADGELRLELQDDVEWEAGWPDDLVNG